MPRSRYSMKLRRPVLYTASLARLALKSCFDSLISSPPCTSGRNGRGRKCSGGAPARPPRLPPPPVCRNLAPGPLRVLLLRLALTLAGGVPRAAPPPPPPPPPPGPNSSRAHLEGG